MKNWLLLLGMTTCAFAQTNIQGTGIQLGGSTSGGASVTAATVGNAIGGTVGGTSNAITISLTTPSTAFTANTPFSFKPTANNTGAATLTISPVATKAITKCGTTALAANDIVSGVMASVLYDGTQYQLQNPQASACSGTGAPVTGIRQGNGAPSADTAATSAQIASQLSSTPQPVTVSSLTASGTGPALTMGNQATASPVASAAAIDRDSSGYVVISENGGSFARVCDATNGVCSGASLPTATAAGQIISSTGAGTTYAVQGQVFYNQTGDTISSIETECSSVCTYVVTVPHTITLGSNHSLSANVNLQFMAGGKWTVNGAFTLTIPGNVSGSLNQHFAGSSTITFGLKQAEVPVEWFGAVGDGTTNDSTAIQTAINSLTGGKIVLQPASYAACGLVFSIGGVGITGTQVGTPLTGNPTGGATSEIKCNSATASILKFDGGSSATILYGVTADNLTLTRTVTPTGTAKGLDIEYAAMLSHNIVAKDSISDFYLLGALGANFFNDYALNGFSGVSIPSGTIYGWNVDGTTGVPSNSITFWNCAANNQGPDIDPSVASYDFITHGTVMNDITNYGFAGSAGSYGIAVIYTGSGALDSAADMHFYGPILDSIGVSAVVVNGLPVTATALSSMEVTGGWISTAETHSTAPTIDIESSYGVIIAQSQISNENGSGNAVTINGGGGNSITGNVCVSFQNTCVELNNTNQNVISSNTMNGYSAMTALIGVHAGGASSNNTISANAISNTTTGLSFATGAAGNVGMETNSYDSSVTTPYIYTSPAATANPSTFPSVILQGMSGTSPLCANGTSNEVTNIGCAVSIPNPLALGGTQQVVSATTNTMWEYTSSNTANTAIFVTNTSSGGHSWADLVEGSAVADVGERLWLDATTGNVAWGMQTTSSTAGTERKASTIVDCWASGALITTTCDTGLSRDSADVVDVGNGTAGDKSGTINAATYGAGALANGMTATTQTAGDNSTKVATTAYADGLLGGAASCSNVSMQSAAGSGASCVSVSGTDGNHQVVIATGTGPGISAALFIFTFTSSRGHNSNCLVSPEFDEYTLFAQLPYIGGSGSSSTYTMTANGTALAASTNYHFHVSCP